MNSRKIYNRYSPTRNNRVQTVKKNCVFIHNGNKIRHEISKSVGAIMAHRWGDLKFDPVLIDMIAMIDFMLW